MNINFTIKDRFTLLQILPVQGSLSEMVDILDLAKQLKLSDKEKQQISYSIDGNKQVTWNIDAEPNKQFVLNSDTINLLKNTIQQLDSQKKITINMVDTALKIQNL